jgi:hypothetical protein
MIGSNTNGAYVAERQLTTTWEVGTPSDKSRLVLLMAYGVRIRILPRDEHGRHVVIIRSGLSGGLVPACQ